MNERAETHACDLIERQAARLAKCPFDGLNDYQRGWNDACDAIADNAPPAQLELANNSPKVDKENGDLIERQAAIDAADRADYRGLTVEDVKKVTDEVVKELKQLPSAQPEIIRCKDCRFTDKEDRISDGRYWCPLHGSFMYYCSDAERREE